jgi:hypothetical protein
MPGGAATLSRTPSIVTASSKRAATDGAKLSGGVDVAAVWQFGRSQSGQWHTSEPVGRRLQANGNTPEHTRNLGNFIEPLLLILS